jgi:hypothetical protein
MLKPERARAELEKVRFKNGAKRRLAALARLPAPLAHVGWALVAEDAAQTQANVPVAARRLETLQSRGRSRLFEALFPRIGPYVEAAWRLARRLPYEPGYDRKVFRAPRSPALTRAARWSWLRTLLAELEGFAEDITWLAAWAGYLRSGYSADAAGLVLAAAVNAGGREGDEVFNALCDSAHGDHPIGTMGRHVTRALLVASRPDGWEVIEKQFVAAQREEGLRQIILETIDEAHPEAFRRMVRLIAEHELARFNSTVRALNVWFGFQWDAISIHVVNRVLERVVLFLADRQARAKALEDNDSETVYLALWATAFSDALAAVEPAAILLEDPDVERRFVAAYLLAQLQIPAARNRLLTAIDDPDLRVALCALEGCERDEDRGPPGGTSSQGKLFAPMERLLARLPKEKQYLDAIVWPWHVFTADRETIAASLVSHVGSRPATVLFPHLPAMDSATRRVVIRKIGEMKKWDSRTRKALFVLAEDASITVRKAALDMLPRCQLRGLEAKRHQELISRFGTARR